MSPLFVIAIAIALIVIGIALNSFHIVHDQPEFSFEKDPALKLAAERQANYHFFQSQRARLLKRQKSVGRYAWLVLAVFIATSWWLYMDAVKATTASKQISAIQTFAVADAEVKQILSEAHTKARDILLAHRPALEELAKLLLEKEVVDRPALQAILKVRRIDSAKEKNEKKRSPDAQGSESGQPNMEREI